MQQFITDGQTLKEIEMELFSMLQKTYGAMLQQVLERLDEELANQRDKKRYYLKDKRTVRIQTLFGEVEVRRNYYLDREKGVYTCLLDPFPGFDGAKGVSPLLEETAIELAVTGPSYRQAAEALEKMVGYAVMSHETIRQLVLQATVDRHRPMEMERQVLFVEADGLYVKRQRSRRRGKEEKILAVHQGWKANGKRVSLVGKRHYVHETNEPVWEGLEQFLIEEYGYDPTRDWVVINGDGAAWITACREYFGKRAFFQLDRFHVAREIRECLKDHPQYRTIRKKLALFDENGLLTELHSAVGTLGDEKKEKQLEGLIQRIESMPGCLSDYRQWLREKGIDTTGMRPMGSAEGTMHVLAKRVKNGRSWCEEGIRAFLHVMVAVKDGLTIQTWKGEVFAQEEKRETERETIVKKAMKHVGTKVAELVRGNIRYFDHSSGTPIYQALKALKGF
ncbi:ISLre2 family transposase [Anoxybacillus flavithermus]|uniref:ISLre2 family transposase n=1 Tax=Anoxybacillus flavithermus TaxID=33934 RepID=UPI00186813F8|nr:ISLre2 family transposase [Anoxybacillus flavithermus]MBE2941609.1 ISLre2 family transposase [Anoxybacillus flavithermus]MBE2944296.1 ISLre2 family transposase [Anoxybacillus flavithermus]MBE2952483.1 ISLre2 family transposase [Anoxybacillus flavithermus]MBE2955187.1 ISLre2 family transposase [Anoxybacillus flavithermus]MBE2960528.1 ISLre2 family transposase [Anoxybacillus flavithermus]